MKKGILYYLHKFVDKTIGYERGMYEDFVVIIIRVHVTLLHFFDFEMI